MEHTPLHIGVMGLAAGGIAAYCREGDSFTFYEVNPEMIYVAGHYFSYVEECRTMRSAEIKVVAGDARLSLEEELQKGIEQLYDILVMDAFTGDSIPIHLLTKEAFAQYKKYLRTDIPGVIAINITNTYLDLVPLVEKLAETVEMQVVIVSSYGVPVRGKISTWAILSRDKKLFSNSAFKTYMTSAVPEQKGFKVWTDDYSNLLSVIKLR